MSSKQSNGTQTGQPGRVSIPNVAVAALAAVDSVLLHWLPDGERRGVEYVARNPKRTDDKRGSFSVNTAKGAWADFATDDKGGDLVALVAYLDGTNQGEAANRLAQFLGMHTPDNTNPTHKAKPTPNKRKPAPTMPLPADAPTPPQAHPKHGKPSHVWAYRDTAGAVLFYIARFDTAKGKEVLPLSLWKEGTGYRWHWKGAPPPRPLYGLDHLAARAEALVVVTEGEKDADAAAKLLPDCVAITSPNGSRAAGKAAWAPVKGRRVLVWPDADEAGTTYARDVALEAGRAGAAHVAVLKREALAQLRGEPLPKGWGAADALAEGIDPEALERTIQDPANVATAGSKPAKLTPMPSRFVLLDNGTRERRAGVYYIPRGTDKATGQPVEGTPEWICSPLRVEALTRDVQGGDWGRLLVFPDRDGVEHRWAMPCAMLAKDGAELREALLFQGLEITAANAHRKRLSEYIQAAEPDSFARCVTRAGWHENAFVLPHATVGRPSGDQLVFQGASMDGCKLATAGTVDAWRDTVAAPCAGNSRLVLAIAAAFAAPCLHLVGLEGGGLHLRGPSSCGKSTALALAASVYGGPDYRREWRATDNALEAVAAMHSDALLPLDEIGQLHPQHAAGVAYLLSNGQGKSRSRRDGTLRAPATWRLLFLSCGEVGLGDLIIEAGGQRRAGMDVRVVDLPADAGKDKGILERVPDGMAAGAFADSLRIAAGTNYGTAFFAWLDVLTGDMAGAMRSIGNATDKLTAELVADDAAGQVRRVARRFALIGAAGELASRNGLTGWPQGEALAAARACFGAWLAARGGHGEAEPRAMIRQVQAFIGTHSEGRFTPMDRADDDRAPKTLQRAGWRVLNPQGLLEHWVLPEVWRNEVCRGFDAAEVARLLASRKLLMPDSGSRGYTRRERVRGGYGSTRVYRLLPGLLDCEP